MYLRVVAFRLALLLIVFLNVLLNVLLSHQAAENEKDIWEFGLPVPWQKPTINETFFNQTHHI